GTMLDLSYGQHVMPHQLGGKVERGAHLDYGPSELSVDEAVGILKPFHAGELLGVWMSHGDRLTALPPGFRKIGSSPNAPFASIAHPEKRRFGIQFHPEVA